MIKWTRDTDGIYIGSPKTSDRLGNIIPKYVIKHNAMFVGMEYDKEFAKYKVICAEHSLKKVQVIIEAIEADTPIITDFDRAMQK